MNIDIATLAIARAQEPDGGQIHQLVRGPQPFPRERPFGEAVNQANEIQLVRHGRELAADGLRRENESTIKHTILPSGRSSLQRAIARRWNPHPICFRCCLQTRRWYQMEGALESVFEGMKELSLRCVVTAGKPGPGHRLPFVGPEPSCRTRQEEHALSIIPISSGRLFLSGVLASIARFRFTDTASIKLLPNWKEGFIIER